MPQWLTDYTQGLVSRANSVAAEPYQPYGGPRVAGFSPDQNAAFDMTRANTGAYKPAMNNAADLTARAGATSPYGAAQPYYDAAGAAAGTAGGISGLGAAAPFLGAAAGSYPDNVGRYMSPYVGNVINRATDVANRNWSENILPGINDQFISNGTYGSSRNASELMRGARGVTEGLQGQALGALDQAYTVGGSLFGQDASRWGALGQTAGTLAGQDRTGQIDIGRLLAQIGEASGNTSNQSGRLLLDAGRQGADIANMGQGMDMRDAAAREAIGSQTQALTQRNLDTAYSDFRNQTNYPREMVDWMSSVIRGMNPPTATTTSSTGPSSSYQPSPLSTLASLYSGLAGWRQANQPATGGP